MIRTGLTILYTSRILGGELPSKLGATPSSEPFLRVNGSSTQRATGEGVGVLDLAAGQWPGRHPLRGWQWP